MEPWLRKYNIDDGAVEVALACTDRVQSQIMSDGGLGTRSPSAMLMSRVRKYGGYVTLPSTEVAVSKGMVAPGKCSPGKGSEVAVSKGMVAQGKCSPGKGDDFDGKGSPGKGFKGECVAGNYGTAVPDQGLVFSASSQTTTATPPEPELAHTSQEIDDLLSGSYYEPLTDLWDGCNLRDVCRGTNVLCKGFKCGRNGGRSTAVEWFNGRVAEWRSKTSVTIS